MKYLRYLFLLLNLSLQAHELSICTIFKDDSKYLTEWIEFHSKRGVEHFYLYDNGSQDHPDKYLKSYIDRGIVTLTGWEQEHEHQGIWNAIQVSAYMDCVSKIKETDKWCAFLDTDEFLFSPVENDLRKVLREYENYSGIMVYWRCYGTSGIDKIPESEKIVNYLKFRGVDDHPWNGFNKCVVQPKYVSAFYDPHRFENHSLDKFDMQKCVGILRINHYWSRDMDFFMNVKINRSKGWHGNAFDFINLETTFNDVYDPILSD